MLVTNLFTNVFQYEWCFEYLGYYLMTTQHLTVCIKHVAVYQVILDEINFRRPKWYKSIGTRSKIGDNFYTIMIYQLTGIDVGSTLSDICVLLLVGVFCLFVFTGFLFVCLFCFVFSRGLHIAFLSIRKYHAPNFQWIHAYAENKLHIHLQFVVNIDSLQSFLKTNMLFSSIFQNKLWTTATAQYINFFRERN